jgi:hypothetical protein
MKYQGKTHLNNEHKSQGQECKTGHIWGRVLVTGGG